MHRPWLARAIVLGLLVLSCVAFAACGSDDKSSDSASSDSSSTTAAASTTADTTASADDAAASGGAEKGGVTIPEVSDADLQKTIQRAFGEDVPADQLPAVAIDAFKLASQEVTPEQSAKVKECLKVKECDLGVSGGITIADLEPNGAINPFKQMFRAVIILQALRTGKVSKIVYSDSAGDLQKFLANYRTMISEKVDVIMGSFDFGPSMLPLTKQASAAGIQVIPVSNTIPKATGKGDISFDVAADLCGYGKNLAEAAVKGNASGTIALYTGTPGNPFGGTWQPCAEPVIKAAGLKIRKGNTNWSPQGETQAAATLAGIGSDIKAVVYDYLPNSFFQKFISLGKTPPTQVGGNAAYSTVPLYQKIVAKDPAFKFYVAPSQLAYPYIAVVGAVEKKGGVTDVPVHVSLPNPLVDLTKYLPDYNKSLPGTAEFGSLLPDDILAASLSAK